MVWLAFKPVTENFLGIKKYDYKTHVDNLLKSIGKMGCNMSIKVHLNESFARISSNPIM